VKVGALIIDYNSKFTDLSTSVQLGIWGKSLPITKLRRVKSTVAKKTEQAAVNYRTKTDEP